MNARVMRAIPGWVVIGMLAAVPARSQGVAWTDTGYLTASGVARVTTGSFDGVARPTVSVEPETVNTTYRLKPAPAVDIAGGIRVWRNLAVGADLSLVRRSATGTVQAQVPHPFFFGKPRAVTGESASLGHDETAIHLQARWVLPATRRRHWQIDIFGGPSIFVVGQDVVQDVTITETYPYDTATFAGVVKAHRSRTHAGFNVGADITRSVAKRVALGFSVTGTHARVGLTAPDGSSLSVTAGGIQVGATLRFAFPRKPPRPSPPVRRRP
jgi:hypothetical protein